MAPNSVAKGSTCSHRFGTRSNEIAIKAPTDTMGRSALRR